VRKAGGSFKLAARLSRTAVGVTADTHSLMCCTIAILYYSILYGSELVAHHEPHREPHREARGQWSVQELGSILALDHLAGGECTS
jgi:hypothetical protein